MDHLKTLRATIRLRLIGLLIFENVIVVGLILAGQHFGLSSLIVVAGVSLAVGILISTLTAFFFGELVTQPVQALWQAILHLSPTEHGVAAPDPTQLKIGRELVTNLIAQIYQMSDVTSKTLQRNLETDQSLTHNFVAQNLPLPLITIDNTETITFVNEAAATYIGTPAADMIGKNVYMVLDLSFPSEDTFDGWLKNAKLKSATSTKSWERVRLNVRDNHPALLFDLASYYNRDNPNKIETMLVFFDHTKAYSQDDQAVSFIALTVHELRTPLTLLRGYIEVFEEELAEVNNPALKDFMLKMRSQAEQLTAFVNNILNVARIDDDQLQLQLQEEQWPAVLRAAIENLGLRAQVRGITLHCRMAPNLPSVGVDHISIQEVINNLVDNAIKYSGQSKVIEISTQLTQDGLVETTVQDFGLGISTATVPNLFTKFYRDHRNRAQIGGTGLGLYLSKAIITAHGGTIWVRSKENEGSTFGFTLLPYSKIAEEIKLNGNQDISRGAHGWIKNHSLYRR